MCTDVLRSNRDLALKIEIKKDVLLCYILKHLNKLKGYGKFDSTSRSVALFLHSYFVTLVEGNNQINIGLNIIAYQVGRTKAHQGGVYKISQIDDVINSGG